MHSGIDDASLFQETNTPLGHVTFNSQYPKKMADVHFPTMHCGRKLFKKQVDIFLIPGIRQQVTYGAVLKFGVIGCFSCHRIQSFIIDARKAL